MLLLNTSLSSVDVQIGLEIVTVPSNNFLNIPEQQAESVLNNYPVFQQVFALAGVMDALEDGKIYVGNVSDVPVAVTPSGDISMDNTGAFTIEDDAVTTQKIDDEAVTVAKLEEDLQPSHVVKFAGQETTSWGNATETIAVVGVVTTDLVFVQLVDEGTNTVSIVQALAGTDEIDVTFSADPGNDAVVNYQVLRAV